MVSVNLPISAVTGERWKEINSHPCSPFSASPRLRRTCNPLSRSVIDRVVRHRAMSFHVFKNEKVRLSAESSPPTARKRRRRTVVTCMPCRLLKVSCDRKAPCSRCVWRGKVAQCTYCEFPRKTTPNEIDRSPGLIGLVEELGELENLPLPRCRADSTLPEYAKQGSKCCQTKEGIEHENYAKISNDTSLAETAPPWYTPKSALRGATHWDGMLHQVRCAPYISNNEIENKPQ